MVNRNDECKFGLYLRSDKNTKYIKNWLNLYADLKDLPRHS